MCSSVFDFNNYMPPGNDDLNGGSLPTNTMRSVEQVLDYFLFLCGRGLALFLDWRNNCQLTQLSDDLYKCNVVPPLEILL